MQKFSVKEALFRLSEMAIPFSFHGDRSLNVSHVRSIQETDDYCVSFYRGLVREVAENAASAKNLIIVSDQLDPAIFESGNFITTRSPDLCFCILGDMLLEKKGCFIHHSAIVSSQAVIGPSVSIGANVVIGADVVIGEGTVLAESSVINNASVGNDCRIAAGVKIGSAGLGSHQDSRGKWHDFPHFGGVVIESSAVIQENTVVHCGTLTDTVIREGARIGPLCWIGHSVDVGTNCFIAQGVTLAGSSKILSGAKVWGNVSVKDGVVIGRNAVVGMGSAVICDIPEEELWVGNPAQFKKIL